jgi:hypothetical protein
MRLKPENEMLAMCFIAVVLIVLASCLGGCAVAQPLQVAAPCPKPNIPPEPHYPAQDLKHGDSYAAVAKAYVVSYGLCRIDNAHLRRLLGGYE